MNDRPFNDYLAHYELTDEEATLLQNDPRVLEVELQADLREGVKKGIVATRPEYHYDSRTSVTTATMKNWGLLRCHNIVNNFLTTGNEYVASLNYQLDGTGVDIVVVDTGVAEGHPEFAVNADGTGGSRVVDFNWASLGVTGCPTASAVNGYLGDVGGHGSHCAGISAGNTCGWAAGARIYSIRCDFGDGSIDITNGSTKGFISTDIAFDLVRAFHLAKKAAGNKRPTICTNSWGYTLGVTNFNYLTHFHKY
jgi:subtilisin family serine protease